ncbi:preprotein translocase subunit SecG [Candidatus Saccharibacteria bacterium]|nr:preprotein translocase subunit SecG [Candidatus Saccharibacteria bacterium]
MDIASLLQTLIMISAILSILLILLQQRGASLGSGSAGSSEIFTTRRGLEKSLFSATIVFVAIFILSILGLLLIPS